MIRYLDYRHYPLAYFILPHAEWPLLLDTVYTTSGE
jgi:hypothetical protein